MFIEIIQLLDTAGIVFLLWERFKKKTVAAPAESEAKTAVVCTTCKRRVVRYDPGPDGPVCANCKP